MELNNKDITQIQSKGLTVKQVEAQIQQFVNGVAYANLIAAATTKNGILKISDKEQQELIAYFDEVKVSKQIVKFVPASGAATRMFKFLFQFIEEFNPETETLKTYCETKGSDELKTFIEKLFDFPFYQFVKDEMQKWFSDEISIQPENEAYYFTKTMLDEDKLNFGAYPKGLFPFHKYRPRLVTAFEEHLFEAAHYAKSNPKLKLHYTISEQHIDKFNERIEKYKSRIEKKTESEINIDFSFQKPSTDTIAVTKDNQPFRKDNGEILFRPAGHGALLENLNSIDSDIVFITNIDNVVTKQHETVVAKNKKLLAGKLLELQAKTYSYLGNLEIIDLENDLINEISAFVENDLNAALESNFKSLSKEEKVESLKQKLDRPIRVCGMVKNQGEPGGGPFWVKDSKGSKSLQIVEASQIDISNREQKQILENATHFNPVDLVCGVKNYNGEKFDLKQFVDYDTAFISHKSENGRELKALELPGLWNGSMAFWNTIFVEVPLTTFNPVKTVNDLLKPAHQHK